VTRATRTIEEYLPIILRRFGEFFVIPDRPLPAWG
jgi:hypothetical protein